MLLLMEEGSDETRDKHEQEKKKEVDGTYAVTKPIPPRDDQNRFEATPPLRRSSRKISC